MRKLSVFAIAAAMAVPAISGAQIVLYDKLGQAYDGGNGAWDGGSGAFGSNYGLQVGQRVANPGNLNITRVVGEWLTFGGASPTSALIQVFALSGNVVGALLDSVTDSSLTVTTFTDTVFGLVGKKVDTGLDLNLMAANGGGDVLVTMQPQSSDWGYIAVMSGSAPNTFIRDYSSFGYGGGYGTTDWTEKGAFGFGSGDANMRVEAVPEPATMLALGAGLAALAARRRK